MLAATVLSLIIKWKSTWTNKTINSISTSTLAVYLITDNHIMREYLKTWTNMCNHSIFRLDTHVP